MDFFIPHSFISNGARCNKCYEIRFIDTRYARCNKNYTKKKLIQLIRFEIKVMRNFTPSNEARD